MSLGDFATHEAQALVVADPAASRDLIEFVEELLATGGTRSVRLQLVGGAEAADQELERQVLGGIDVVVLVRVEPEPSRGVRAAARWAAAQAKPVCALVLPGVDVGLPVAEVLQVPADPRSPTMTTVGRLWSWATELPQKHGRRIR